jgi:hypothetical protein
MADKIRKAFGHSINRGTGRAVLIQRDHPFIDFSLEIIKACHEIISYDFWSEDGGRELYLHQLIQNSPQQEWIIEILLDRLQEIKGEEDYLARRLLLLAKEFAKYRDQRARNLIYEKYIEFCKAGYSELGMYAILELDGLDGLFFVAENIGKYFGDKKDFQALDHPINYVQKLHPDRQVENALYLEARQNPFVHRYLEMVFTFKDEVSNRKNLRYTYEQIIEKIKEDTPVPAFMAQYLPTEDFLKLANDLLEAKNPKIIKHLLRLFSRSPYPLNWKRLLPFLENESGMVEDEAIYCLKNFKDPLLREIALKKLKESAPNYAYLELLHRNVEAEDYLWLYQLMEEGDDDRVHSIGYEVLQMFKELPAWQAANALQLIYERNYCSTCREDAVLALDQINAVPDVYRAELPFDCSSKLRKHFSPNNVNS